MDLLQRRDAKGCFTAELAPDVELAAKWAHGEERAAAAEKACARFKVSMDSIGIRKNRAGVWMFGVESGPALFGLLAGAIIGRRIESDDEFATAVDELIEAAGIRDEFLGTAMRKLEAAQNRRNHEAQA